MSASSCSSATAVTVTGSCGRAAGAGRLYAPAAVAGHFWRSPSTLAMGCSGGSPLARKMVLFGSLVFVGLTAGAAYVVWFDYDPSGVSPAFYAETMQHAIRVLTVPLPAIVVLGLIFTVLATFQARNDRAPFFLLAAASLCIIAVALITSLGNIPINNQILTWNIESPPANWAQIAGRWWRFQTARLVLQTFALCLVSSAALIRMSAKGSRPV